MMQSAAVTMQGRDTLKWSAMNRWMPALWTVLVLLICVPSAWAASPSSPTITWPPPTAITYGTPLSDFQLDATISSGVVQVPVNYNVYGIYPKNVRYATGGFDNDGYSYSSNTLNSSIQWNGMTFAIGPAGQPDAVANTTIALPGGAYTQLFMLGAMVNNITTNPVTFTVTYSDKSTATFTQSISDWFNVAGYPGESVVTCQEDRNFQDGTSEPYSVCIYGYQIPLDGTKTVESLTLPNTRDIVMLAFDLTTAAVPGNLVYTPPAGTVEPVGKNTLSVTFTPTDGPDRNPVSATVQLEVVKPPPPIVTPTISWPQPANIPFGTPLSSTQLDAVALGAPRPTPVVPASQTSVISTSTDKLAFGQPGFDGAGHAFSYNALNNGSVNFAGTTFTLGQPTVPNAITDGAVYTLPKPGVYSAVYLLGAATTNSPEEPFLLTYSDGTTATQSLDMSSWSASAGYPDETIVATTPYANTGAGGSVSGAYNLYGYALTPDSTRSLVSVTLPGTRNVVIMALGFSAGAQAMVPGRYVYDPRAGKVLAVGTWPLSVTFTPTNASGYTGASGSTQITVVPATAILNWPTPAAISTTTRLSNIQLDATPTLNGKKIQGTYLYTVPPGTADAHGQTLSAGTHTLQVVFTPSDATDITPATATVQIVVGSVGATGITGSPVFSSGDCCFFSQPTPYAITVTGSVAPPTGTVNVIFNGQTLGTGTLTPGSGPSSTANLSVSSQYLFPGNNNVTLAYLGDANYVPFSSAAVIPLRNPAITANPATARATSTTIEIPFVYVVEGAATFNFTPVGGNPSDFTNISATQRPACQSGVNQAAGTNCMLSVRFAPGLPGIRKGVVEVDFTPASGNAEPRLYLFLSGFGSAAQISLSSAMQQVLNSTLSEPQSITFDPTDLNNAKLYVANSRERQIDTLPASGTNGPLTQWNATNTADLVYPSDLTFDSFENLVVADANAPAVYGFSPTLVKSTINTGSFTLGTPTGTRFDHAGNLYIADGGDTPRIIEVPGETDDVLYTPTQLNTGNNPVSFPEALAIDNTGANLYVGDGNLNEVLRVSLDGSGSNVVALAPCATGILCVLNQPAAITFDPHGDMFVADVNARVLMVPANHSSSQPTIQLPLTGLVNPTAVVLDGSGNVIVSDLNGTVTKLLVNSGSLTFPGLGATLTTTISNTGDLPLSITSLSLGHGNNSAFTISNNGCTGVVAPGASCTIALAYSNSGAASQTDTLSIGSNAFSTTAVTINLSHN